MKANSVGIRTPMLIMSDVGDFRVPIRQSFEMYHALKDNGVTTKFIAYPSAGISLETLCDRPTRSHVG